MTRSKAIVTGVLLGWVAVGVLTLLGALGLRQHPPVPAAGAVPPAPQRPELRTALLAGPDLPPSFAPSPQPPPARPRTETRDSRCGALLADPAELIDLAAPGDPGSAQDASVRHTATDHSTLDQALRVLTPAEAGRTYSALLATASACRDFAATVDGTRVRVRLDAAKAGLPLLGDSYSVRLTVSAPGGEQTGYLAVGRIGSAVSVLRRLGPAASGEELDRQVVELLGKALDKILPLTRAITAAPGQATSGPRPGA